MKHIMTLISLFLTCALFSQESVFNVIGTVVELNSQESIEFASIVIKQKATGEFLTGATTSENGKFSLKTRTSDIIVEVSFIGFSPVNPVKR